MSKRTKIIILVIVTALFILVGLLFIKHQENRAFLMTKKKKSQYILNTIFQILIQLLSPMKNLILLAQVLMDT